MIARAPTLVSWSGGKDSAMALLELRRSGGHEVTGLLTTIGAESRRVAFHNVGNDLVRAQARAMNLPLREVPLPPRASNVEYEAAMRSTIAEGQVAGGLVIAYGDLFLEDIRRYREEVAARLGVTPVFPVWKRDTRQFAQDVIAAGFNAIVVSVDLSRLDSSFAGRRFDAAFLADLPANVDPCGENGEFHSFVVDGPVFLEPVAVTIGARAERGGYSYRELKVA